MVVFIDLDDDIEPPELSSLKTKAPVGRYQSDRVPATASMNLPKRFLEKLNDRTNPNKNVVTEALGCYPSVPPGASNGFNTYIWI
jgi:hypothetical protein